MLWLIINTYQCPLVCIDKSIFLTTLHFTVSFPHITHFETMRKKTYFIIVPTLPTSEDISLCLKELIESDVWVVGFNTGNCFQLERDGSIKLLRLFGKFHIHKSRIISRYFYCEIHPSIPLFFLRNTGYF